MPAPNQLATLTPFHHCTDLEVLSLGDLDRHSRRAEDRMNQALEQRRWGLVRCYRETMLAVLRECDRRITSPGNARSGSPKAR